MPNWKAYICGCLLACSAGAQATLIDHGDYLTDTLTGFDWLDVTKTLGQSYDGVTGQLKAGGALEGWRYASGLELNTLVGDYTGVPISTPGFESQTYNNLAGLVALLGVTYNTRSERGVRGILADTPGSSPNNHWAALVADSLIEAGFFDYTSTHDAIAHNGTGYANVGSFLVRAPIAHADIPEPGTLSLLGLGLSILVWRKQRQRQNPNQD